MLQHLGIKQLLEKELTSCPERRPVQSCPCTSPPTSDSHCSASLLPSPDAGTLSVTNRQVFNPNGKRAAARNRGSCVRDQISRRSGTDSARRMRRPRLLAGLSSVRCRTDGERGAIQTPIKSRCALRDLALVFGELARLENGLVLDDVSASRRWKLRQRQNGKPDKEKVHSMLYTVAVVLLVLWLLGLVTSYTMGGFIHILLVVAVIMVLLNVINGRRSL